MPPLPGHDILVNYPLQAPSSTRMAEGDQSVTSIISHVPAVGQLSHLWMLVIICISGGPMASKYEHLCPNTP